MSTHVTCHSTALLNTPHWGGGEGGLSISQIHRFLCQFFLVGGRGVFDEYFRPENLTKIVNLNFISFIKLLTFLLLLRCMCGAYSPASKYIEISSIWDKSFNYKLEIFFVYQQERRKCNLAPPSRIYHQNMPYSSLGWIVNRFLRTTFTYDTLLAPPLLCLEHGNWQEI